MKPRRVHDVFKSTERRFTVLSEFGDDSTVVIKNSKNWSNEPQRHKGKKMYKKGKCNHNTL